MKDATVTINYETFQSIKEKANRYDNLYEENNEILSEQDRFINALWEFLDAANDQRISEGKQYFIAKGIQAVCERYRMDVKVEYDGLDEGRLSEK